MLGKAGRVCRDVRLRWCRVCRDLRSRHQRRACDRSIVPWSVWWSHRTPSRCRDWRQGAIVEQHCRDQRSRGVATRARSGRTLQSTGDDPHGQSFSVPRPTWRSWSCGKVRSNLLTTIRARAPAISGSFPSRPCLPLSGLQHAPSLSHRAIFHAG